MNKKILLGMSGGTDSSVAAILLLEQGYEVTGITFRFWEDGENKHLEDARDLALKLGIRHYVYDARELFKNKVIRYFVDEYMAGRTPFPCVRCNNELKWKLIVEEADRLGCDRVAMGHYVSIKQVNGTYFVTEGVDPDKDQSFFLWGLSQPILSRIVFPLGNYFKTQVREIAYQKGFVQLSEKKDSLGACFCSGDYRPFLKSQLERPEESIFPGNFVDEQGNILGRHEGYPLYTVGQRRGLIYLNRKVFVKEIRINKNEVVLADLSSLYKESFFVKDMVVSDPNLFSSDYDIHCRIRYRKQNTLCRVVFHGPNSAEVQLAEPLESIAPGQSAVFYRNEFVLGGGFIV